MFKNSLALLSCFCLLSSCVYERLSVYTDYVGLDSLASYHIGTPDPELANPHLGQRLLISWRLSREYREREDLQIRLTARFIDRTQITVSFPIASSCGTHVYTLLDEEFAKKKGFLTYKAELLAGDEIIETWTHQLWVEIIDLNSIENKNL